MSWSRVVTRFRGERFGFVLIASSLLVIALICGLHLDAQLEARAEQNRAEGLALARVLSTIPLDSLVPKDGGIGPLEVLRTSQANPEFAYGVIVAPEGRVLAQVRATPGPLPDTPVPHAPADWIGERTVPDPSGERVLHEFVAPVIEGGRRVAHVRVGFREPDFGGAVGQASFLALMALPIFLLTPLAYVVMRRATRPLTRACEELNTLTQEQRFAPVQLEASGEVGQFISGFNRFMSLAQARVETLEQERTRVVASSKVVAYQKTRIEAVLETLPDATLVMDETGNAIFANAKLEPMLGASRDAVLGKKPEEWCRNPEILALLARCTGREASRAVGEMIEVGAEDGSESVMSVAANRITRGEAGDEFVGTLVVLRDVTHESVARRAHGEFVSHVAHELKAPLNVMSMYGESLVGTEGEEESFRVEASNTIRDEVERLSSLINTLLSIARIETGAIAIERQRVRLHEFLDDAVAAVARGARSREIEFHVDVPQDVRSIYIDKDLFRVALNNLLTNAVKYNDQGGSVTVTARDAEDRIVISVADTGIGISEDDLPHVFDKFYRSSDVVAQKRGGHGLGLSLAREIVELHGGRIRVQTRPEDGSEFSIELRTRASERGEA